MAKRKKAKKRIVLHPVMTFIVLIVVTIILSGVLSLFNISSTYSTISNARLEYVSNTESVNNLLSLSGIKYVFSNTVANFANFTVLSHLIIVLIGIGVMEYSGFLKTAIGLLTRHAKKKVTTFVIVLIGIMASIMDSLPFIAFLPLTALIYKYGKRNPNIGIVASFAALTCGYGVSIFFTSVDSSLASLSTLSASLLDPTYSIKTWSMLFVMLVTTVILALAITFITENYVAKKLPKYDFEETEVLSDEPLTKSQMKGLLLAGIGSLIYLIIFVYNIIPGLPFSGNFLNHAETLYIDKLFGAESFFANGFVFIVTMLFIIWGLLYGFGAKTIKNNHEFVASLGHSLNGIGKTLVFIFAGSTFIAIFKQTNIGNIVVAGLTNLISNSGVSGITLIFLLFISAMISTVLVPGTINKWAILSTQVVPTFLSAGMTAEFAQVIFRFGESVTLGLTPLFAYFIVYLAYLDMYNQDETNMSLKSAISYQAPYSVASAGLFFAILLIWYIISLPLGIEGAVAL